MFVGCKNLTSAPNLPATTLEEYCYQGMFNGCTNLGSIKFMSLTEPSTATTADWVVGVKSTGTFTKNSAATWTNKFGKDAIPNGWTVQTASN